MESQISYNQYVKTINPIDISSTFLLIIPHDEIQIRNYENPDGSKGCCYGRYESEEWDKFLKDINANGIKEYITLQLDKSPSGMNEFRVKDGIHRLHAIKHLRIDKKIPVMIEIDTSIPFDELRDLFNMMTQAKMITNRDYAALLNQFVLLQLKEIKHGFWNLLSERNLNVHSKYKGQEILDFVNMMSENRFNAYLKVSGIDFAWSFKNGKLVYKFEDGDEVFDVSKKYPLYSVDGDGDIIKAATKAVEQFFEKLSTEAMRAMGIFKGNWIDSTIVYGEVENFIPYNASENYVRLNNIMTENGVYIKGGRELLEQICNTIGNIIVTSEVVEYEGYDLNNIKYYTKNKTSVWRFEIPRKVDENKLKQNLLKLGEVWRQYPEYIRLASGDMSQEVAETLITKINKDLSSGLGIKEDDIIEFLDSESTPLSLKSRANKKEIDLVNIAKRLEDNLNWYIAKDVLGLSSKSVGIEYITRFNSNPDEYLETKSLKFSKKNVSPKQYANMGSIIEKINIMIQEYQRLELQANELVGIEKDKTNKIIKGLAYNALRLKSYLYNAKTYSDLLKAFALYHHIFTEGKNPVSTKLNII